jgi:glycosyltransferase involved in cell wall biosynthesis
MPKISVVMPVYNQERYVKSAVDCVLKQTFSDFEFIIVDDGSTDGTSAVLNVYKDKRIRLLQGDHAGFLKALQKGIAAAGGKWIARMDSDDICHPDRLRRQIEFLHNHPECNFVTTTYGILTPNNHYLEPLGAGDWRYLEPKDITLATYQFCDPATVFDREKALAVGYDSEWENEKPLWYKLLEIGKGALLAEPLYYIRWLIGSHSRSNTGVRYAANYAIRAKYDVDSLSEKPPKGFEPKKKNINLAQKSLKYYLAAEDFAAARAVAKQLLQKHPFDLEAWKLAVRAAAKINGDIKVKLRNSKFAFAKVDTPWM